MCVIFQVYRGPDTVYRLEGLSAKTDYLVRVCAVRQCGDGTGELLGAFSPGVTFTTASPKPVVTTTSTTSVIPARMAEPKQLTDQQWAVILLLGFTVCAVLIAFLAQQIIAYTSNSNSNSQ